MRSLLLLLSCSLLPLSARAQDTVALIVGGIEQLEDDVDPTIASSELFGCPGTTVRGLFPVSLTVHCKRTRQTAD